MIRVHKPRLRLQAADAALLAAARMLGRQSPRSPDPGPFTDPLETLQPQRRLPAACAAGGGCVSEATDSARTVIRMRSQELEEALQYPQSSASTDEIAILREKVPPFLNDMPEAVSWKRSHAFMQLAHTRCINWSLRQVRTQQRSLSASDVPGVTSVCFFAVLRCLAITALSAAFLVFLCGRSPSLPDDAASPSESPPLAQRLLPLTGVPDAASSASLSKAAASSCSPEPEAPLRPRSCATAAASRSLSAAARLALWSLMSCIPVHNGTIMAQTLRFTCSNMAWSKPCHAKAPSDRRYVQLSTPISTATAGCSMLHARCLPSLDSPNKLFCSKKATRPAELPDAAYLYSFSMQQLHLQHVHLYAATFKLCDGITAGNGRVDLVRAPMRLRWHTPGPRPRNTSAWLAAASLATIAAASPAGRALSS